ncbi:hypothetical protein [Arthrobacter sp. GMC3]|uniref:hypothetical protein n=1 Tax=Arthrobacter sp. GMC3 TaxID=2058894 RepID=UPI000CE39C5F|nr:hypothetical protein [Arthrobacter sp. GMC3]
MSPKQKNDPNAEMPVAVRASASWERRTRWPKTRYRHIQWDARFRDGREEFGVKIDQVLQGWRYPADAWCVRAGAERECPEEGIGLWVDYPYGQPL